jgi:hypothetical protein
MKIEGVIMGVGAPNDSQKHGKTFCAILLTKELGFIRVYPIHASNKFPVWGMIEAEVERGSDARSESYKIIKFNISGRITDRESRAEILNSCILKSGDSDPIDYQNEFRRSICLIKPSWGDIDVTLSQKIPTMSMDDEECLWIMTQGKHWFKPYITWQSDQGKTHKTHLGGREIYEGIRNNPHQPWELMNNLQIMNPDYDHWMLMGNMNTHKNVWLCVHLHRLKKSASGSIPLCSHPIIGENAAWPYERQETINVEFVEGHPTLFTMKGMTSVRIHGNQTMAT